MAFLYREALKLQHQQQFNNFTTLEPPPPPVFHPLHLTRDLPTMPPARKRFMPPRPMGVGSKPSAASAPVSASISLIRREGGAEGGKGGEEAPVS